MQNGGPVDSLEKLKETQISDIGTLVENDDTSKDALERIIIEIKPRKVIQDFQSPLNMSMSLSQSQ